MKSILQSVALLSAAALIASCDSSSGGGAAGVGVTPPAPQVSVAGSGVKGIISGGTVVATDATGTEIGRTTTTLDGSYALVYDTVANPTIVDPITVTITGGSAICDFRNTDGSGNDCPTGQPAPNDFVAFSESYDLGTLAIRSIAPNAAAGGVSNISPATEIALLKALEKAGAGVQLTSANATEANLAIAGLLENISGVSFAGVDINTITPANLAATGAVVDSDVALVLAAFASSVIGNQGTGTLAQSIAALAALFTIDANGNATGTGPDFATLARAFAQGLANAQAARPSNGLANAAANANANAAIFDLLATVTVPPSTPPGTADAVSQTKSFVLTLATVINEATAATGAQGSGGQTALSVTEAFANEIEAVRLLTGNNVVIANRKLREAVLAAVAAAEAATPDTSLLVNVDERADGDDTTTDDGVEFTITGDATAGYSIANASSRWPLEPGAVGTTQEVLTATDGTATDNATGFDTVDLNGVSLVTSSVTTAAVAADATAGTAAVPAVTTVIQTATGDLSSAPNADVATSFDLVLNLNVVGANAAPTFAVAGTATVTPTDAGTYTLTFTFADAGNAANNVALGFNGTIGSGTQGYSITTNSGSVTGQVIRDGATDAVTITDGVASLALTVTNGDVVVGAGSVIGQFSVGTTNTATLGSNGVVSYDDGSIQLLPAIIFPEPVSAN